jgi:phage N-6-adenine-methyltransferase
VLEPEVPAGDETSDESWYEKVFTGDEEWYTPEAILTPVRQVLGEIDLDPASCEAAQARVQARTYYSRADDGLRQAWHGKIFLNPPYKLPDVARFIGKLFEEWEADHATDAIVIVNSATSTAWFQRAFEMADAVCFPQGKIKFHHATKDGQHPCTPQTILYYGDAVERFCAVFAAVGVTTRVVISATAYEQLVLERREAAGPPASAPVPEPASAEAPPRLRDQVGLQQAVWLTVQQLEPCTNSQVRAHLGEERSIVHAALQALVKQGKVVKAGATYRVVPGRQAEDGVA